MPGIVSRAARHLLSSSGLFSIGSISDGQVLVRSGTSVQGASVSGAGAQPLDATLTALAGLATGANKVPYSTGTDTFSQYSISSTAAASTVPVSDSSGLLDTWTTGGSGWYGDGSDSSPTISGGTTTLTRDMQYQDLTIASDGILATAGYRVYVRGTLTIASGGVIQDDGASAAADVPGAPLGARGVLSTDSGGGATGRTTTGAGSNGSTPSAQVFGNTSTPNGGAGGQADGSNAGGTGGVPTVRSASGGTIRVLGSAIHGRIFGSSGIFQPGGGGGGGAAGGANIGTGTARSGGGGAGGGSVVVICRILNSAGTIRANGGNGGNASVTGNGKAGGGGGGGGGWVSVVAGKVLAQGTLQAAGGTKGTGAGTGSDGVNGSAGYTQIIQMAS